MSPDRWQKSKNISQITRSSNVHFHILWHIWGRLWTTIKHGRKNRKSLIFSGVFHIRRIQWIRCVYLLNFKCPERQKPNGVFRWPWLPSKHEIMVSDNVTKMLSQHTCTIVLLFFLCRHFESCRYHFSVIYDFSLSRSFCKEMKIENDDKISKFSMRFNGKISKFKNQF